MYVCSYIQKDTGEGLIFDVDNYLEGLYKPKQYWGKEGVEVQATKGFESTCIMIAQQIGKDPKTMTTIEFYQALEILRLQNKPQNGKPDSRLRSLPR